MRQYYIFDVLHDKYSVDKLHVCEVAAKLRLYHVPNYSEQDVNSLWKYNSKSPSLDKIIRHIRVKNVKWYINSHTEELIRDPLWNSDFLMGMLQWGKIYHYSVKFPTFIWFGNFGLSEAIASSNFAGSLNATRNRRMWSNVPALCLNHSTNTIDYIAGILSTGVIKIYKDKIFASYNIKVGKIIRELGIPIEYQNERLTFISPFWAVILQNHMPEYLKSKWHMIDHAYRAKEYSAILWKIYTGKDPVKGGMPYLPSRKTIFNKYGSLRALRDLWLKDHLVELDIRFKKVIQEWQEKIV